MVVEGEHLRERGVLKRFFATSPPRLSERGARSGGACAEAGAPQAQGAPQGARSVALSREAT